MSAPTKICSVCDADLSGQKRVKDPAGNYFCHPCWQARLSQARSGQPTADRAQEVAASEMPQGSAQIAVVASEEQPTVAAKSEENPLKIKLSALAVGLGAIAFFDVWPIIQVGNHAPEISISYKGKFLGWWALTLAIMMMLPERIGFVMKRTNGKPPITLREKILFFATIAIGIGMTVLTGVYFSNQGYSLGF